jgi:hypothetical protein
MVQSRDLEIEGATEGGVGRDSVVGIGDRIQVRARFSAPVHTDPGAHPASYKIGAGSLSQG